MQENNTYKLVFNSKEYDLPVQFNQRASITPKILTALQKDGRYTIQSSVTEEILEPFIRYLSTGEAPKINESNRSQFIELSHEFDVMGDILKESSQESSEQQPTGPVTNEDLMKKIIELEQNYNQRFEEQNQKIQELTETVNHLKSLHRNSVATIQQHTEVIQQIKGTIHK